MSNSHFLQFYFDNEAATKPLDIVESAALLKKFCALVDRDSALHVVWKRIILVFS
jgi:hypothetical protein